MKKQHTIFLHLPKCGGNSLRRIIQRQYKEAELYYSGGDLGRKKKFEDKAQSNSENPTCSIGHLYFGIHEGTLIDNPIYLTMMREPVSRVISLYNFIKSGQAKDWLKAEIKNLSFSDYIRSGLENDIENCQTRRLAGLEWRYEKVPFGELPEEAFHQALKNIENHFVTPGLQERFDESILLMHQQLKWKMLPFYLSKNITRKNSVNFREISREDLKLIRDLNKYDIQLYDEIKCRFEKDLVSLKHPELKMKLLKTGNWFVRKIK